uniref:Reverse transcriptase domain-containing protein n=1 Tax=Amphimedon queenslandica TaxID=400682 RepID=A0A1X7SYM3_AMPQE
MAETREKVADQAPGLIYTLECLGFSINWEKTILEPSQHIEFLGFMVDSTKMELSLPAQKIKKIRAWSLHSYWGRVDILPHPFEVSRHDECHEPSHSSSSSFLQEFANGPNFGRAEWDQNYETNLNLSPDSSEELIWWDTQMITWNGRAVVSTEPDLTIESDASMLGWGASYQGTSTGGLWSHQEKQWHINCVELLAATLAVKTFLKNKVGISVLLKINNTTAVAYRGSARVN